MNLFTLLFLSAMAAEPKPPPTEHQTAILVSPIGPVTALVANAVGTPAFDANLRAHHMVGDRLGWTVQTDFLRTRLMDVGVLSTSIRGGPRFALRKRGLADWSLNPYASVGYSTIYAAHEPLAHYGVLGLGVEAGRTWVWNHFTMELGLGVYSAVPIGYASPAEVLSERRPPNLSPIKPSVTWSVGYAF